MGVCDVGVVQVVCCPAFHMTQQIGKKHKINRGILGFLFSGRGSLREGVSMLGREVKLRLHMVPLS